MPGVHFKFNLHRGGRHILPELKDEIEMAYATQEVYERILQSHPNWCKKKLPLKFDYPGGCALNKQANDKVLNRLGQSLRTQKSGDPAVV